MGLFSKLKQFGERMEAASQQMMNMQLSINVDNQEVKIGGELSGTITVTSQIPCAINDFQVNLLRETGGIGIDQSDKKQWIFNKENIQTPLQLQAGETKTVPFKFIVKDGLDYQPLSGNAFGKASITPVGLNPAVLPDPGDGAYTHKLTVTAQIEGAPIGPVGGIDIINFTYPSVNVSGTFNDNH